MKSKTKLSLVFFLMISIFTCCSVFDRALQYVDNNYVDLEITEVGEVKVEAGLTLENVF